MHPPLRFFSDSTCHGLNQFSLRKLEESGLSRDTIIRARRGERVHPSTCTKLAEIVQELERDTLRVLKE